MKVVKIVSRITFKVGIALNLFESLEECRNPLNNIIII
jgi:hypothetical protein